MWLCYWIPWTQWEELQSISHVLPAKPASQMQEKLLTLSIQRPENKENNGHSCHSLTSQIKTEGARRRILEITAKYFPKVIRTLLSAKKTSCEFVIEYRAVADPVEAPYPSPPPSPIIWTFGSTTAVITRRRTAIILINVACTSNIAGVTDTRELVDTIATKLYNDLQSNKRRHSGLSSIQSLTH